MKLEIRNRKAETGGAGQVRLMYELPICKFLSIPGTCAYLITF